MGKGQGPALVAQILLILCVVSDGSLLANGQETRTLQKVTTHNLLLLIKGRYQPLKVLECNQQVFRGYRHCREQGVSGIRR